MRVVADQLSIAFGSTLVLENLTFTLREQAITALRGPSGSGKSSLLAAISGSVVPTHGGLWLEDSSNQRWAPSLEHVAWVPQGGNVVGGRTSLDNISLSRLSQGDSLLTAQKVARSWLVRVGLAHREGTPAKFLSGGERQRLVFARALAVGRPLLLADEPSAGLDRRNTENIAELMRNLSTSATIVVATHDDLLASACDAVVDLAYAA